MPKIPLTPLTPLCLLALASCSAPQQHPDPAITRVAPYYTQSPDGQPEFTAVTPLATVGEGPQAATVYSVRRTITNMPAPRGLNAILILQANGDKVIELPTHNHATLVDGELIIEHLPRIPFATQADIDRLSRQSGSEISAILDPLQLAHQATSDLLAALDRLGVQALTTHTVAQLLAHTPTRLDLTDLADESPLALIANPENYVSQLPEDLSTRSIVPPTIYDAIAPPTHLTSYWEATVTVTIESDPPRTLRVLVSSNPKSHDRDRIHRILFLP